ncbi:MAG: hypothetical protein RL556_115 [Actinomycetota bacterium]|jgi:shikimate kinase
MSDSRVVVLVGPMGVGKTTLGKKLATALDLPFFDTDALVVRSHGEIKTIFENLGEEVFRKFEEDAVLHAISSPAVVATGGGAILSQLTRQRLHHCTVVYLETDGKHVKSRLKGGKRPLVQNGFEDWIRIYEDRKAIYEEVADITIDTSNQTLSATLTELKEKLEPK